MTAGWHILSIEVNMPTHGKNFKLKTDAWLAREKGDALTARTFVVEPATCEITTFKPRALSSLLLSSLQLSVLYGESR